MMNPANSETLHQYFEYGIKHKVTDSVYYHSSSEHLIMSWLILAFLTVAFAVIARLIISINIKDEKR